MLHRKTRLAATLLLALLLATPALHSQGKVTSPKEQFGFNIGELLFEFSARDSYLRAFAVGMANTLRVSLAGIVLASLLGRAGRRCPGASTAATILSS